jgi:uncharacterized protein (DUF2384 family)
MRPEAAVAFLNVGLKREKMALASKGRLLAKLAKRLETDSSLVDLIAFAQEAFDGEEAAYRWLATEHMLLNGRSPIQAMLDGDGAHVRQLLANIEYGMPV